MELKEGLERLPTSPGVYILKGIRGKILYVGKAKNLRNRLRSYFQESAALDMRKAAMVREVKDFEYIVTDNELEALILESNLIKRFKPRYNIILRDDKNYPYLRLTVQEEWPRLVGSLSSPSFNSIYTLFSTYYFYFKCPTDILNR